jgi:murein L,D-transpeptidase YafK
MSSESSIEILVEKWRHAWEEGDLQTYIGCYHPDFKARGMNIQAWKEYKQDLFNRTPERQVKISDINVELNGSRALVTFKQHYQTKNYEGLGLKTFQLTNYLGNWAILEESYESFPTAVEPVEAEIRGFVENWRRAWEEGDFPTYISCYHPDFKTEKMDIQEWKIRKQELFRSSEKRNIQISDVEVEDNSSSAVVTFKQKYQAAKHQDLGLKTLHLRRHHNKWTILKENWQPLSGQG